MKHNLMLPVEFWPFDRNWFLVYAGLLWLRTYWIDRVVLCRIIPRNWLRKWTCDQFPCSWMKHLKEAFFSDTASLSTVPTPMTYCTEEHRFPFIWPKRKWRLWYLLNSSLSESISGLLTAEDWTSLRLNPKCKQWCIYRLWCGPIYNFWCKQRICFFFPPWFDGRLRAVQLKKIQCCATHSFAQPFLVELRCTQTFEKFSGSFWRGQIKFQGAVHVLPIQFVNRNKLVLQSSLCWSG